MSSYFMFYNPRGTHEVLQAQSEMIARQIQSVPGNTGRVRLFRCGQTQPNALEIASIIQAHDCSLAAAAIVAYPKMTGKAPETRAKQAFKKAFDRSADTKNHIHEAEALSVIVMLSGG